MTLYDNDEKGDSKEIERLRNIVKQGETFMAKQQQQQQQEVNHGRKRKRGKSAEDQSVSVPPQDEGNTYDGLLSKELLGDQECAYGNNNDLMIVEKKKKAPASRRKKEVKLTPQELKYAKQLQKKSERKLKQLEMRAAQKEKRKELYNKLQETALSQDKMELLSSSSTLGKKATKKETLQKLLKMERAGIALTTEEQDLLNHDRETPLGSGSFNETEHLVPMELDAFNVLDLRGDETTSKRSQDEPVDAKGVDNDEIATSIPTKKSREKKKKKRKGKADDIDESKVTKNETKLVSKENAEVSEEASEKAPEVGASMSTLEGESSKRHVTKPNLTELEIPESKPVATSFAAQMMASLTKLKTESKTQSEKLTKEREERQRQEELERENRHEPSKRYIPENTAVLKTAAALGISPTVPFKGKVSDRKVREIQRPTEVAVVKYDLPVATVEFEVMDAIRNNDVTIICAETGSGKSTQVVQFLYEYGMSSSSGTGSGDDQCIIGVTQPRRVAAVSTAKRVCYEMGQGNGQSISNSSNGEGNLVAYQTRYETAGLGSKTHIKFMTDGILLQEIQTDLLLRKYSVIILDEFHERGLNTDVLIGLLSAALPLRKEAASEEGSTLSPLKIIIMSATLRVEDFTGNKDLFPSTTPAVVRVPGRTHPVTIHHSKVTELDKYGKAVVV